MERAALVGDEELERGTGTARKRRLALERHAAMARRSARATMAMRLMEEWRAEAEEGGVMEPE